MQLRNAMKRFNHKPLKNVAGLCLGLVLCSSLANAAEPINPNWEQEANELINTPMIISWQNNGRLSKIQLIKLEDGQLTFQVEGQPGEAAMPLDTIGDVVFQFETAKGFNQAIGEVGEETFNAQHLDTIRKTAYPMAKFVNIPAKHANFVSIVRQFMDGLIQMEQLDEALYLVKEINAPSLGPSYEETTLTLGKTFLEDGSLERTIEILDMVNIEEINLSNSTLVFDVAHILRGQEKYEEAINIYKKLSKNKEITNHEAEFWAYYCALKQGQHFDNHTFVKDVKKIEPGEPGFPLQQLVIGTYFTNREQHFDAMRAISEGIAYATPVEEWTPELMYRSAVAYQNVDMNDISVAVLKETVLFFPSSSWASAANEILEN